MSDPRPTRVVIAEDEAIIRLDLKELLQEEHYDVVGETGRGDEAVELVRDLRPDLVILDIKMPGLDGLSAARVIAGERLAAVLMVTAFSQRELVEQARDARRHADAQARHADSLRRNVRELEREQDSLLDRISAELSAR